MIKYGDLTIVPMGDEELIFACDTLGAIGEKEQDHVKAPLDIVAKMMLRVVLLEIATLGAKPELIFNLSSNEYEPTAKNIQKAIEEGLQDLGIENVMMNGSSEENFVTNMTASSIVLMGRRKRQMKCEKLQKAMGLFQWGEPYIGDDVVNNQSELPSYHEIVETSRRDGVLDILPIGSKGAIYEATELEKRWKAKLVFDDEVDQVRIRKSGGPSTSLLILCSHEEASRLEKNHKIWYLGEMIPEDELKL